MLLVAALDAIKKLNLLNLNGIIEMEDYVDNRGIRYFGKAKHSHNNKFQCHAYVGGALCLVEFGLVPND